MQYGMFNHSNNPPYCQSLQRASQLQPCHAFFKHVLIIVLSADVPHQSCVQYTELMSCRFFRRLGRPPGRPRTSSSSHQVLGYSLEDTDCARKRPFIQAAYEDSQTCVVYDMHEDISMPSAHLEVAGRLTYLGCTRVIQDADPIGLIAGESFDVPSTVALGGVKTLA